MSERNPSWNLCGACGTITPDKMWTYWHQNLDEATEIEQPWVPARDGEGDPMALCPVCKWEHRDTDDGFGVWTGTCMEMEEQRATDLPEYGESWQYTLLDAAKRTPPADRDAEREALLGVEEAAQHIASALLYGINRSERLQAELTAYGVPLNVLSKKLADLHETRNA